MGVKFGARIVRGIAYGVGLGAIFDVIMYLVATAINGLAGTTVVNPSMLGLVGLAIGLSMPVAIEISKEMESAK